MSPVEVPLNAIRSVEGLHGNTASYFDAAAGYTFAADTILVMDQGSWSRGLTLSCWRAAASMPIYMKRSSAWAARSGCLRPDRILVGTICRRRSRLGLGEEVKRAKPIMLRPLPGTPRPGAAWLCQVGR